ncbi:SAC3 family protein A-like protein [Drosera capensis]
MMNQGESVHSSVSADPGSIEKCHLDSNRGQTYQYYSPATVAGVVPWPAEGTGSSSLQNPSYQYNPQPDASKKSIAIVSNATSHSLTSSNVGVDNGSQAYTSYDSYRTPTSSYGYGSSAYQGYYDGYQQQASQLYTQTVEVFQNTGAPHQPLSSFQNTGSYAGSTSYPSTYHNTGDYQTSGAYAGSNYSNSTNSWNQGTYGNYSHLYPNYNQNSSSSYTSNPVASSTSSYQQQYKQWTDYYNETEVICAPGTEKPVTSATTSTCNVPGVSAGYVAPTSLPQPSYSPSWRAEYGSAVLPTCQTTPVVGSHGGYLKQVDQSFPNYYANAAQPTLQQPLDTKPLYPNAPEPQKSPLPQGLSSPYAAIHQRPQTYQPPLQPPPFDTQRVSKLQIPTNPRIASNLAIGLTKTDKDSSATPAAIKPAYVSVSFLKPKDERLLGGSSNPVLKPTTFPASLRGYVERALARCKGESQMTATQEIMKQIITKATADNSLHTRDWDTEPLFPLPDISVVAAHEQTLHGTSAVSIMSKFQRSPNRRSKSRWEPLPEEKPMQKSAPISQDSVKYVGWSHFNGNDKKFVGGKLLQKDATGKFSVPEATTASTHRPAKKQRFGGELNAAQDGDASSDGDKEQELASYYSGTIALANTPEERKKRESRSKRFEKGRSQGAEMSNPRRKAFGAGNLYARRASAMVISRAYEDSTSRAVEDIDWDALTVKGTSQELEKRYLRLTSAPDPATVRPEEVLERALLMVQNSEKNYLYKCDQLKAIRQDLTVQRIRNELTVKVYETHARLALEYGDLPEYNQCQSQLKSLYAEGIVGRHFEFSAYNLLGVLHSNSRRDLLASMSRLSVEAKGDEAVKHALAVQAAVTSGNYVSFFRLYKTSPNLNTCLMDLYVEKMRFEAVKCMSRAYRPTVPVSYIAYVLGFNSLPAVEGSYEKEGEGMEECADWLRAHGACVITDAEGEQHFDTKASSSTLYMPEPEDAVAHGDANLAVNDFFTRMPTGLS